MAESLAQIGRERLYGKICYPATTRPTGASRVHPVTPIIGCDDLYVFMEPTSPKSRDLNADKPYALHSSVRTNTGEGGEFLVDVGAMETDSANERQLVTEESSYEIK